MSEDGVMNVEDDGPELTAEPVAEVPAVEAVPAEIPADDAAEVEVDGKVMVPLAALKSERMQRQAAEKELNRVRPYADFIEKNPGLVRQQAPAPPAPTTFGAPPPDPRVERLAKTLDLYTPEGKPDLDRGAALRQMIVEEAQQISQQQMAPLHERSAQDQSARNFQIALAYKGPDGKSPSAESLAAVWRSMPAAQSADPQVASVLTLTALGMDSVARKPQPAAPANAPIVTEGTTSSVRRASLSQLESNLARERGITDSKWAENTKGFLPGRSNQLED